MTEADLPAVVRIQAEAYPPAMQEDEATIRARLRLAPDLAWVAEEQGAVVAYLVCYRSIIGKVTPLNGLFEIPPGADTLYLHDLAVSGRSRGLGTELARNARRKAGEEGLKYAALVSVQGSRSFWEKLGYAVWERLEPAQLANLRTYPTPAWYMIRKMQ